MRRARECEVALVGAVDLAARVAIGTLYLVHESADDLASALQPSVVFPRAIEELFALRADFVKPRTYASHGGRHTPRARSHKRKKCRVVRKSFLKNHVLVDANLGMRTQQASEVLEGFYSQFPFIELLEICDSPRDLDDVDGLVDDINIAPVSG
jgi:hypothetical protein